MTSILRCRLCQCQVQGILRCETPSSTSNPGDEVYLRLHKGYTIPSHAGQNLKLTERKISPLKVIKAVGRLAYRLEILSHWRIHPVISVAQLEPKYPGKDLWDRPVPTNPEPFNVLIEHN